MHSEGLRVFSRMTKAARRRWIVRLIELCFYMAVMSIGCVATALIIAKCLQLLGVAYGG